MNTKSYSVINGIYYTSVNAVSGFVTFFLLSRGLSNTAAGTLIAVVGIINFFLQPILGTVVDHFPKIRHQYVIGILAALCFLSGLSLIFSPDRKWYLLLFMAFSIIMTQLNMPIINSLSSVWNSQNHPINFGVARGIGSASYAVASFIIGYLSDEQHFGPGFIPVGICITSGLLLIVMIIISVSLSKQQGELQKERAASGKFTGSLLRFIKKYWIFMIFVIGTILIFIGHNIITGFTINIVAPIGGSGKEVGIIGGIAAACEIPTMFLFSKINKKISNSKLIMVGGLFFTLKLLFCLIAFRMGNMGLMYVAQTFQLFGFALFIPASVEFVNSIIDEKDITLGQAFFTAANTAGGILGSQLGGSLLDLIGVKSMMVCTVILSAIGTLTIVTAVLFLKKNKN